MWPFNRNTKPTAAPKPSPLIVPEIAPEWTASDVVSLRAFLNTPAGHSLIKRGRAMEYTVSVNACQDVMHTAHSAARAAGITDTLNWLESLAGDQMLSRLTGEQVNNADAGAQEDAAAPERRSF